MKTDLEFDYLFAASFSFQILPNDLKWSEIKLSIDQSIWTNRGLMDQASDVLAVEETPRCDN